MGRAQFQSWPKFAPVPSLSTAPRPTEVDFLPPPHPVLLYILSLWLFPHSFIHSGSIHAQ